MTDEYAIQQTLNRYSEGASRADWPQVMSTFVADGTWEVPAHNLKLQGHEAIQAGMKGFTDIMDYIVQTNAPAMITVDGDTASARSVIRECGKYAGRDVCLEILGTYTDTLVRTAEGWKFTRRIFRALGRHEFAILPPAAR